MDPIGALIIALGEQEPELLQDLYLLFCCDASRVDDGGRKQSLQNILGRLEKTELSAQALGAIEKELYRMVSRMGNGKI